MKPLLLRYNAEIYRLPNFNMLFQLVVTKFSKANCFCIYSKNTKGLLYAVYRIRKTSIFITWSSFHFTCCLLCILSMLKLEVLCRLSVSSVMHSPRLGIGKALRHAQMAHKFRKCRIQKLPNEPSIRPGRVIGDKHFNLCINFVIRKIKTWKGF